MRLPCRYIAVVAVPALACGAHSTARTPEGREAAVRAHRSNSEASARDREEDRCARLVAAGFEPLDLEIREVDHFSAEYQVTIDPEAVHEPTVEELVEDLRPVTFCGGRAYAGPPDLEQARWVLDHRDDDLEVGTYCIGDDGLNQDEATGIITDVRTCRRWLEVDGERRELPLVPCEPVPICAEEAGAEPRVPGVERRPAP